MADVGWMKRASNDAPITRIPIALHPDLARQRLQRLSAVDPVADEERAPIALTLQAGIADVVCCVGRALLSHSDVGGVVVGQEPVFQIEVEHPRLLFVNVGLHNVGFAETMPVESGADVDEQDAGISFVGNCFGDAFVHGLGESVDALAQVLGNFRGNVCIRLVVAGEGYVITLGRVNIEEMGVLIAC